MREDRNQFQIIRKDARNCFVESLNDSFSIGRIHLAFAAYDQSKPAGQRQTNNVHIYIAVDEFLELCRKLDCGELRYMLQSKKKNGDNTPLYQCLGGTSAEKLRAIGRARPDGKSLSRVAQLIPANKADFLFVADSGPGETNEKGLIVPKFGNKPENHVAVMMSFESLSEMFLITRMHYQCWLTSWYQQNANQPAQKQGQYRNALGVSADMIFCDVIDAGVTEKNNQLDAKVSQLSTKDRKTVYDVLDLLVRDLSK